MGSEVAAAIVVTLVLNAVIWFYNRNQNQALTAKAWGETVASLRRDLRAEQESRKADKAYYETQLEAERTARKTDKAQYMGEIDKLRLDYQAEVGLLRGRIEELERMNYELLVENRGFREKYGDLRDDD